MSIQRFPVSGGAAFVAGYVALDWISYLHEMHGLNITPWNPSLALGLVFWFRHGAATSIYWFIALLLGEVLVRGLPAPPVVTVVIAAVLTAGYGGIAEILQRAIGTRDLLYDRKHLAQWLLIVLAGTLVTSALYIAILYRAELIPVGDWQTALLRFWIGDFVGVVVTMPFFWCLFQRSERLRAVVLSRDALGYVGLAAITLWIVFGFGTSNEFQFFYLLFPPIVLAAARQGIAGASFAAFVLQAGIMLAVRWTNVVAVTVFEVQLLAAVLAAVAFFIGVVIDEKERLGQELRLALRLAAAGEMAAALAHELNQPLTALTTYGKAAELLVDQGETGTRLRLAIRAILDESQRAAGVLRRLRDFFRTGATKLETIEFSKLIDVAIAPFSLEATKRGVTLRLKSMPCCRLHGDRLQLEIVLRNLLSNAFDSVATLPAADRWVEVAGMLEGQDSLRLSITDGGPGIAADAAERIFEAFQSTKSSGLGLGLAISRAIVEAHGGQLWAEAPGHGQFFLVLPVMRGNSDGR